MGKTKIVFEKRKLFLTQNIGRVVEDY